MKKILSLTLVLLLLVSMIPTVFAADYDLNGATSVTLIGDGEEEYNISVPASLMVGESGTVTISGKWASHKTVKVTAPNTVTLYYGDQSMNVGVTFNGISASGSDINSVSVSETITIADAHQLFGTWVGTLYYDIEIDEGAISFTIDGTEYQAERNMTWQQWEQSDYAPAEAYCDTSTSTNPGIVVSGKYVQSGTQNVIISDTIIEGHAYTLSSNNAAPA